MTAAFIFTIKENEDQPDREESQTPDSLDELTDLKISPVSLEEALADHKGNAMY